MYLGQIQLVFVTIVYSFAFYAALYMLSLYISCWAHLNVWEIKFARFTWVNLTINPSGNLPGWRVNFSISRFTWVKCMMNPPGISLKQKLYMVYSFTFYAALYMLSLSVQCHLELSKWTGQSCIYCNRKCISQFLYYFVMLLLFCCCCCSCCCVLHNNKNDNYKIHINW